MEPAALLSDDCDPFRFRAAAAAGTRSHQDRGFPLGFRSLAIHVQTGTAHRRAGGGRPRSALVAESRIPAHLAHLAGSLGAGAHGCSWDDLRPLPGNGEDITAAYNFAEKSPGFVRGSGRHGLCSARHDKSVTHAWWCGECRWKERAASRTSLGAVFHFGAKESRWACSPCYGESMVVCAVTPGAPTGRTCSAVAVHAITAAVDPVPPSPAPRQLRETAGRVRCGGARGQLTVRAGRGFHTHAVAAVCRELAVRFSITIRQHKSLRNLIEAIPEEDWRPIPYWMGGAADVAETTYTPFQSEADAAPVRLIVRRVRPTPGSQLALFASYSYHAFITGRDGEMLELEADHRRHAEIENAIRDLKYGVGLNHLPSGRFPANGAWLAVQVMAHNLARWTARIGLGERTATTKTLRRRFFALAGRLTRSARRLTLHLPKHWLWETQFSRALARLRAIPFPA